MDYKRGKLKSRRTSGAFAAIPHFVMHSEDFRLRSNSATKILLLILSQYNGRNNGDLCATNSKAKEFGVKSPTTLSDALRELMDKNLIVKTRYPLRQNPGGKCSLYAIT